MPIQFQTDGALTGDDPRIETQLLRGELITAVELPPNRFAENSLYRKVRDRASYAFALVSIAGAVELDGDGRLGDVRLALGGVAPRPWRARVAEDLVRGLRPDPALFRRAAAAELQIAKPLTYTGFKVEMARRLIVACLSTLTQPVTA